MIDLEKHEDRISRERVREAGFRLTPPLIGIICIASWAVNHSYQGIVHDARLYALQALSESSPSSIGHDVFLKFGSQDRYTLFSPAFAAATQLFGIEPAAECLTLLFQLALILSAWWLICQAANVRTALLGLCTFVAVPANYGADQVFACIEPFVTPRMLAEALSLAAVGLALRRRIGLAVITLVVGALIHPIMALAGFVAVFWRVMSGKRPMVMVGFCLLAMLALLVDFLVPQSSHWGRFDPEWFELVQERSPFLFLSYWQLNDWSRVAISISTLALAWGMLPRQEPRELARIATLTAVSGLALTFVACDQLHLVVFTQMQPWRCQWIATAIAALLMPALLSHLWQYGTVRRASALCLASAWIFGSGTYALAACVAAVISGSLLGNLRPSESRWVIWGSVGMLAIAVTWRLASNMELTDSIYLSAEVPTWMRDTMSFCRDGTAPLGLVGLTLWLERGTRTRLALPAIFCFGIVGLAGITPQTWRNWTEQEFRPEQISRYAGLREVIPEGSDVFWPEDPLAVWILLGRSSYLSIVQTSGMVFSRESALELKRRAKTLGVAMGPSTFLQWSTGGGGGLNLSKAQLLAACGTRDFDYLISHADLGVAPVAFIAGATATSRGQTRLYQCRDGSAGNRQALR